MFEEYPKHLYKVPGLHAGNDGITFDFIVVHDTAEEDAARADGWKDFADAITPKAESEHPDDDAAPTREEMEAKAHELGVDFSPNIGDKKLGERIQAALDKGV